MTYIKTILLSLSLLLAGSLLQAQDFRSPLDIPLVLSGTFGELRSSHFHSGIDIKTQGREGLGVYAIEAGQVVRVKVSTSGYGKAIYILHPSGHMSVYAHLQSFSKEIDDYVRAMQYAQEKFEVELFPDAQRIQVQKGDLIGLSGNTGGSFGPHLHFEVRNASGEIPLNPLSFNFPVLDTRAPEIRAVYLYVLDSVGAVIETIGRFDVLGKKELKLRSRINGQYFGLAVETYDKQNAANNLNGNYGLDVSLNGEAFFGYKMDKIAFSKTRYLNAFIDYSEASCCSKKPQNMFLMPNNPLDLYTTTSNGRIKIDSSTTLNFDISAFDIAGNKSELKLELNLIPFIEARDSVKGQLFKWNQINNFISDSCRLYTPDGAFYHDFNFEYKRIPTATFCPVYQIHKLGFPVHKHMRMLIRPDSIGEDLKHYVYPVSIDADGNDVVEPGTWDGDFMAIKTRSFGEYTLRMDSTAPTLKPINIKDGGNYVGGQIRLSLSDEHSGVKWYKAKVNGKFILFEFEPKKNLLFYNFDGKIEPGANKLEIVATDVVGNASRLELNFNFIAE